MSVNLLKNDSIRGQSSTATWKSVESVSYTFKDRSSSCPINMINLLGSLQRGVTPWQRTCENSIFKYDRAVDSSIRSLSTCPLSHLQLNNSTRWFQLSELNSEPNTQHTAHSTHAHTHTHMVRVFRLQKKDAKEERVDWRSWKRIISPPNFHEAEEGRSEDRNDPGSWSWVLGSWNSIYVAELHAVLPTSMFVRFFKLKTEVSSRRASSRALVVAVHSAPATIL